MGDNSSFSEFFQNTLIELTQMNKKILLIPLVLLFIGAGYIVLQSPKYQPPSEKPMNQPAPSTSEKGTTVEVQKKTYTLADIASHGVEGDCWTSVDGTVYDLSSFTSDHPGGPTILKVCGKDGTDLFYSQHGQRQKKAVESMIIGTLESK